MPTKLTQPRGFYVSATKKSSGKTVISLGIAAALTKQNLRVQSYKKGPDYIDPMWHHAATGKPCFNLDFFTQTNQEISATFNDNRQQADVVYVEGNKGLFDGVDTYGSDCNAALAELLGLPVLLVLNTVGVTRGIAPLLSGYENFSDNLSYTGVILNEVGGPRHQQKLIAAIEHYTDFKVLGSIPKSSALHIQERHLGLIPENEADFTSHYVEQAAQIVTDNVDLGQLLENSVVLNTTSPELIKVEPASIKIGVARDSAFGFYYQDDLQAMQDHGAELVYFSPIADTALPDVDALFIGGGFPETHLSDLERNRMIREEIKTFIEKGKPVYAECGGLMYLTNEIEYLDQHGEMVGAISARTTQSARPIGRGYAKIHATQAHLWNCAANVKNCHEFHYSELEQGALPYSMAYDIKRGHGVNKISDGVIIYNTIATYCHQRHTENNPWVAEFIHFIKQYKQENEI